MAKQETAIEIGKNFVGIAQAEVVSGVRRITGFGIEKVKADTEADCINALKALIKSHPLKSRSVLVLIGRDQATIRYLRLPAGSPEEIEGMVEVQAVRQLPFSREEIIYSRQIIEKESSGFTKIILAIVHRELIGRSIKLMNGLGLKVKGIDITSNSLAGLITNTLSDEDKNKAALFIGMGSNTTELLVSQEGRLLFSRSIRIGGNQFETQSAVLAEEIRHSIEAYKGSDFYQPLEALITLNDEKMVELLGAVSIELGLTVQEITLPQNLFKDAKVFSEFNQQKTNLSWLGLFGCLLDARPDKINLLPPKDRYDLKTESKRRQLVSNFMLGGLVIALAGFSFYLEFNRQSKIMLRLKREFNEIKPQAEKIEESRGRLNLIKKQLDFSGSSLDLLDLVYNSIPQNSYLTSFDYKEASSLTLQGLSSTMSEIFEFVKMLKAQDRFTQVELRYATKRKTESGQFYDFQIWCNLK